MQHTDLIVVGAGQAGLATAATARAAGMEAIVLEAGDTAGGSWRRYYDSLRLFSPARYSELPGRPFGGDRDRYPTRDEVVAYLAAYADESGADIRYGHRAQAVAADGGELIVTADDTELAAPRLIAATGSFGKPHRPDLPGLDGFTGQALHAADYRSPADIAGRRVVVIGGGNSAVQIAVELAGTASVTLATRSPLRWFLQRPLGRDLHWWLTRTGLDTAPVGRWLDRSQPVLDDGRYRAAIRNGAPDHRPLFDRVEGGEVVWTDGSRETVDTLLFATGYRPDLDYLADTGALDSDGQPLHRGGVSTTVPGLGYVGLELQRAFASATVRGVGRDARHVLARLPAREPARQPRPSCCAIPVGR